MNKHPPTNKLTYAFYHSCRGARKGKSLISANHIRARQARQNRFFLTFEKFAENLQKKSMAFLFHQLQY